MEVFSISLAGFSIKINSIYKSTYLFCKEFLCEDKREDFSIYISQDDIEFEREKSEKEDLMNGIPVRYFSNEYLETLAVYRKICTKLLEKNVLLFHGSAIEVDGEAYLFTAKSGTGKSTHTALWRQMFGNRAIMINDDKPLLKVVSEGVCVCGTPWNGKHRLGCNKIVPLKAICILERSETNQIYSVTGEEVISILIQQSFRTGEHNGMIKLLDLLSNIIEKIALFRLECNMSPEAAKVSYEGMKNS